MARLRVLNRSLTQTTLNHAFCVNENQCVSVIDIKGVRSDVMQICVGVLILSQHVTSNQRKSYYFLC